MKLSPSEKAKMEEAKAKLAMLEREEQDIKVGVSLETDPARVSAFERNWQ